jgi:hypothetical protein
MAGGFFVDMDYNQKASDLQWKRWEGIELILDLQDNLLTGR